MQNQFHIFTDGSSIGNPGPGGWAAVLHPGGKIWELSGSCAWTTISEMELRAAVEALRSIPAGARVELRSDSKLLIHGMRFRVFGWQIQGWRNSRGIELQHQELWRELICFSGRMHIRWRWIKGHNEHAFQTRADALAYREARNQLCRPDIAA